MKISKLSLGVSILLSLASVQGAEITASSSSKPHEITESSEFKKLQPDDQKFILEKRANLIPFEAAKPPLPQEYMNEVPSVPVQFDKEEVEALLNLRKSEIVKAEWNRLDIKEPYENPDRIDPSKQLHHSFNHIPQAYRDASGKEEHVLT